MLRLPAVTIALAGALTFATGAWALELTVNSSGDETDANPGDGTCATAAANCTFRAALEELNATGTPAGDPHRVLFSIPGVGIQTITPASGLPPIDVPTVIDAWSQGGLGYDGTPLISIDGSLIVSATDGLAIRAAGSSLRGINVHSFGRNGVILNASTMVGSYIGTDPTGVSARPNGQEGVIATNGAVIGVPGGLLQPCRSGCNVISGNLGNGIEVGGANVVIIRTNVGLAADGISPIGNGRHGVFVPNNFTSPPVDGTVGRINEGNRIAFNGFDGIAIETGDSGFATGFEIRGNRIFNNGGTSIDLGNNGPSPNDPGDIDIGANTGLNSPFLVSAVVDENCRATVTGFAAAGSTIDFYSADDGEGQNLYRFIASVSEGSSLDTDNTTGSYDDPEAGSDTASRFSFEFDAASLGGHSHVRAVALSGGQTSEAGVAVEATSDDTDGDNIPDAVECSWSFNVGEDDSDDDGIPDGEEIGDFFAPADTDGDGTYDVLDSDDDGDTVPTSVERQASIGISDNDVDDDGSPNWLDWDSDADGLLDGFERNVEQTVGTADDDDIPAWLDADSDNDGLCDGPGAIPFAPPSTCDGGEDTNLDGVVDPNETDALFPDSDSDGICDGDGVVPTCTPGPDNCPRTPNPDQLDSAGTPLGDLCECGDGFTASNEGCDDGNTEDTDGCTSTCEVQDGFTCTPDGTGSSCTCSNPADCFRTCYSDQDGDGFNGTPQQIALDASCDENVSPNGMIWGNVDGGDCDDENPQVHPNATEVCDTIDNDCDEDVDSDDMDILLATPGDAGTFPQPLYVDGDGDGCGVSETVRAMCTRPESGFAIRGGDADDTDGVCCGNEIIDPGEACDTTATGDAECPAGLFGGRTCNNDPFYGDGNGTCTLVEATVSCVPGRICYADLDGDGLRGTIIEVPPGSLCETSNAGPNDLALSETSDNDCIDSPSDRCAPLTYPGAPELCDLCDNDCDPDTADGISVPGIGESCDSQDADFCETGVVICFEGNINCDDDDEATVEICDDDGVDEDCNGFANDDEPDFSTNKPQGTTQFYRDEDGDGCGLPSDTPIETCSMVPPDGYVANEDDIDDTDGTCCFDEQGVPVLCGVPAGCGNGILDEGETCDTADPLAPLGCRPTCTFCGDGVLQIEAGESCEPVGANAEPDCRVDCTLCGDGVIQSGAGEDCDDGNDITESCAYGSDGCTVCSDLCVSVEGAISFCGDGFVDEANGELCDGEQCNATCDEIVSADEGCACSAGTGNAPAASFFGLAVVGLLLRRRRRRA